MADYRAKLVNCVLPQPMRLDVTVGGFTFELHQHVSLPMNPGKLRGTCCHTTDVWVRNVSVTDRTAVRSRLDNLSEMLSFATEGEVACYWEEYPANSGLVCGQTVIGTSQCRRPPFHENWQVQRFVERCAPEYILLREPRRLHVAIDYIYHSVFRGLAEEIKIALACITFECLRDNWARSDGYPHIDGYFREKGSSGPKADRVGFKRHLAEMFEQVGLDKASAAADAQKVVDIRNEVLHTGLFRNVSNDEFFEFLQTALRTYLLRLLKYNGQYFGYVGGDPAPLTL